MPDETLTTRDDLNSAIGAIRSEMTVALSAVRAEFEAHKGAIASTLSRVESVISEFASFTNSDAASELVSVVKDRLAPLETAVSEFFAKHQPNVEYRAPKATEAEIPAASAAASAAKG